MKHIALCCLISTAAHAVTPNPAMVKAARERLKSVAQWQKEHDAKVMKEFKLSPGDKLRELVFERRKDLKAVALEAANGAVNSTSDNEPLKNVGHESAATQEQEWRAKRAE